MIFRKNKERIDKATNLAKEIGPYINLGWQLAITVGLGVLIGWWIDKECGTKPLWLIICSFVGVIIGLYSFLSTVLSLSKKKSKIK